MYIYLKKCIKNTLISIIMLETCEIYYYIVYILPMYRTCSHSITYGI